MELVLTIIAGLGVLLFLIGYLAFVMAGFRHHFVTGIIAALPVLNIVTVPALWHRTSKRLMLSVLGLIIVAISWFLGADTKIKKLLFKTANNNSQVIMSKNNGMRFPSAQNDSLASQGNMTELSKTATGTVATHRAKEQTSSMTPFANQQRFIDESNMQMLPAEALYRLSFEPVPVDRISTLNGRIIEITLNTHKVYEGKVTNVSNSSVLLLSGNSISIENEFPIANIKQLRLMVKKGIDK